MARPLQRARLEGGLKLDLNWLVRNGFVGKWVGQSRICWSSDGTDQERVQALLTFEMKGGEGYLRIQIGDLDQRIKLAAYIRNFGGQQWYFICPVLQKRCSVVWRPTAASKFASAPAWKRQAAYTSQFQTRRDRAISAARKVRMRLGGPHWIALDGRDPSRPKGMRWRTYRKLLQESHRQMALAFGWLANKTVR